MLGARRRSPARHHFPYAGQQLEWLKPGQEREQGEWSDTLISSPAPVWKRKLPGCASAYGTPILSCRAAKEAEGREGWRRLPGT